MKTINYFAVLALVFSLSCKKDNANTNTDNLKLELVAASTSSVSDSDKIILDVKSYNAKTGEIIFSNNLPAEWKYKRIVNLYNGDAYLFSLTYTTGFMSSLYNEPVLHYALLNNSEVGGGAKEKDKWYILSGYPFGKLLGDQTISDSKQLESFQKIKSNWDVFVDELKKSGKYIN